MLAFVSAGLHYKEYMIFPLVWYVALLCVRLEEKLSDMETENQVLRQQALLSSSSRRMSGKLAPATTPVKKKTISY